MSGAVLAARPTSIATDSEPLRTRSLARDPHWWAGALLSTAGLAAVGVQLGGAGLATAARAAPTDPLFWIVFGLFYLVAPLSEWFVFRRLWRLPVAGLVALLRKQVANELVVGYSGDAHFYLWARRHARLETSPFGAVKDVAVLSAVAGNIVTLLLMLANWDHVSHVVSGPLGRAFATSAGFVALTSLALFLARRRLFSLSGHDLATIFATHVARIVASMLLLALLWHLLLPALPQTSLLVLATMRMMLSRLPFLPAKEVVFAGLVAAMVGASAPVVPAIALLGSLVVAAHVCAALGLLAAASVRSRSAA